MLMPINGKTPLLCTIDPGKYDIPHKNQDHYVLRIHNKNQDQNLCPLAKYNGLVDGFDPILSFHWIDLKKNY